MRSKNTQFINIQIILIAGTKHRDFFQKGRNLELYERIC